jgi:PilZ domain
MMERRTVRRIENRIPVVIERPQAQRFGVTRDIGDGGVLLNTPSSLEPGERVHMVFHELQGTTHREATVLRRMSALENDPWRYLVALEANSIERGWAPVS